jgi:hypothetical protein
MISVPSRSATRTPTALLPVAVAPTSAIGGESPRSRAFEAALDLGTVDDDARGSAVGARTGIIGAGECVEQRGDLARGELLARPDRGVAGEKGGHAVSKALDPGGGPAFEGERGHFPDASKSVCRRQLGRKGENPPRSRPDRLDRYPKARQSRRRGLEGRLFGRGGFEEDGLEQALARLAGGTRQKALIQDALVGGC